MPTRGPSARTSKPCCTATADGGKSWTAAYNTTTRTIQFRAASSQNAIAPGQSVRATIQATAPSTAGHYTWLTQAKQSNSFSGPPGNDFVTLAHFKPKMDGYITYRDEGGNRLISAHVPLIADGTWQI